MSDVSAFTMMRVLGSNFNLYLDLSVPFLRISAGDKVLELRYRSSAHSRRALLRAFKSFRFVDGSGSADDFLSFGAGDNDKVITGELPEGDKI